tara:strand:- start:333 stop:1322 length:990 start_codon:yes stop_codon:yes gene_type:complete
MTTSDNITKNELKEIFNDIKNKKNFELRIFEEGSTADQKLFEDGGCTFSFKNKVYGSCDAVIKNEKFIIAIEMTDALNRGSTGSAQIQRFHHALGAVKNGYLGIYYLRKGKTPIRSDLYGMAYNISKYEKGTYLIVDDLRFIKELFKVIDQPKKYKDFINKYLNLMQSIFESNFKKKYKDWKDYFAKRSTLEMENYICRYQANSYISFTEGQARGGHLALGELYLGKYLFDDVIDNKKKLYMLFPRLEKNELNLLKTKTQTNKELNLIFNEENTIIKTLEDISGIPRNLINIIKSLKKKNLNKNPAKKNYKESMIKIFNLLKNKDAHFK